MRQRVAKLLVAQAAFLLCSSFVSSSPLIAADYVNSRLPWHPAVLDSQGRVLAVIFASHWLHVSFLSCNCSCA